MINRDRLVELSKSTASRGKAILRIAKELSAIPDDPFIAARQMKSLAERAAEAGIPIDQELRPILEEVEAIRVRVHAEFWDRFSKACHQRGWTLSGTTPRRLLCQGIFLKLGSDNLVVEELQLDVTPYVHTLVEALAPHVAELIPPGHTPQAFVDALARAYDALSGPTEKSLEDVFKMFVNLSQKPSFWRFGNPAAFTRVTRPAFRARVATLLASGVKPSDGREVTFGTTLSADDVWEIYSPGEDHAVQVGRIAFAKRG